MQDTNIQLLVFAHKGEASAFIVGLKCIKVKTFNGRMWSYKNGYLLITGEGSQNVLENLKKALYYIEETKEKLTAIVNLGCAASLKGTILLEKIVSVATIFSHINENSKLVSMETNNIDLNPALYLNAMPPVAVSHQNPDSCQHQTLYSSNKRIYDKAEAIDLPINIRLVDREAYTIGQIAYEHNCNFYCYKYVSDRADSRAIDAQVKASASIISARLYAYFKES